ncbi:putative C2H2 finger domain protein [Aspergillus steynii IBT 23096]|uniref:Putative C2H2 finger domain protein n=1 Tax=Aspergillus steynii IBT 23096 TaxID=1392250 RepID=A0A2I2GE95_9EURO|nr:putative C2H2 finger domain protein [Aspergillus steynii IBT 23096]PLB51193.1 putative C2H2 finger domain protein [Aspergillus steynii IBT 23096]
MAPETPTKVPCTYSSCLQTFDSVMQMQRHKIIDINHEYCKTCDEDFDDEETFLIHRIKSDKHIVCPICGLNFRSEGGRDGHIRQNHHTQQLLTCHGCKEKFRSASGLMRHLEADECPYISQGVILKQKSQKLMIKEALKAGEGSPMPLIPDPAEADDVDGGVKVKSLAEKNREAMTNQPFAVNASSAAHASADLATQHWPALSGSNNDLPRDLMSLSGLEISSSQGKDKSAWKSNAREGPALGGSSLPGDRPFGISLPNAGQTLRLMDEHWQATNFLNSFSGQYVCPCGSSFSQRDEFEEHVLQKSRSKRVVQCPNCLRRFKTTAALIAHCESPSTRCDINNGDKYGQIIDELTGGLIQAVGYHADGTVKYEAGKFDLPKSTTVGVNLREVKKS